MFRTIIAPPRTPLFMTQKRFRVKKKWASNKKSKSPPDLALGHFDTYYPPVYGNQWTPMRVALLTLQKYCALVNTFSNSESAIADLTSAGADDIFRKAREWNPVENSPTAVIPTASQLIKNQEAASNSRPRDENEASFTSRYGIGNSEEEVPLYDPSDIHQFMPVKRVLSETDQLLETESEQSRYEEPTETHVRIIKDTEVNFPSTLKVYAYGKGEVDSFPAPPKDEMNKLAYYLMDAASVLPVIALGLAPGDTVLDLCSAPGGKTLTMLQTHLPGQIVCVDHSYSRLQRLKEVLRWYTPKSLHNDRVVSTLHGNGVQFCRSINMKFDKILVDVPCYADRHVLHEEENNIFRKIRMKERLEIQHLQKELLSSALQRLKPGGTLVYSTCTLAMQQNDGTVHAALEDIWRNTNIDLAVVDTAPLAERTSDTFTFYERCRFGQLVMPNLLNNFGPTYFSKIRRLK